MKEKKKKTLGVLRFVVLLRRSSLVGHAWEEYARRSSRVSLARIDSCDLGAVLYLVTEKPSGEVDCKNSLFFFLVRAAIIISVLHGKPLSTLFKQRGLFSKLVGSLRRNRRPNAGREDIELANLETRRNRAYTSDARLNMAR